MACSGLPSMPDAIPDGVASAVGTAAAAAHVEIAALSGTYNMIHPDPAERARGHRRLAVLAAAAAALPTRLITLCTGTRDPVDQWRGHPDNLTPEAWRDLLAAMETAVAIAERHDVMLGIEPELANVVDSAQKARRLIDESPARAWRSSSTPPTCSKPRRSSASATSFPPQSTFWPTASPWATPRTARRRVAFTTAGQGVSTIRTISRG